MVAFFVLARDAFGLLGRCQQYAGKHNVDFCVLVGVVFAKSSQYQIMPLYAAFRCNAFLRFLEQRIYRLVSVGASFLFVVFSAQYL